MVNDQILTNWRAAFGLGRKAKGFWRGKMYTVFLKTAVPDVNHLSLWAHCLLLSTLLSAPGGITSVGSSALWFLVALCQQGAMRGDQEEAVQWNQDIHFPNSLPLGQLGLAMFLNGRPFSSGRGLYKTLLVLIWYLSSFWCCWLHICIIPVVCLYKSNTFIRSILVNTSSLNYPS